MKSLKRRKIPFNYIWKTLAAISVSAGLIMYILSKSSDLLAKINLSNTLNLLGSMPSLEILLFAVFGIAASFSMVLYDYFVMDTLGYKVRLVKMLSVSFIANTLSNIFGLAGLTGSSIKMFLYKNDNIKVMELIHYNVLLATASITGLSFFSFLTLLNLKSAQALLADHRWLFYALIGFTLYLPAYFFLDKFIKSFKPIILKHSSKLLFNLRLKLLGISIFELLLTSLMFYVITLYFHKNISYSDLTSIFAFASIAGFLTFLPGGIGSFDLIAIIGLQLAGVQPSASLAILITYRVFYYFIPGLISMIFFAFMFIIERKRNIG